MAKSSLLLTQIHYNVTKYKKKSQKELIFFFCIIWPDIIFSEMHAQIKVLILFRDVEHDTRK